MSLNAILTDIKEDVSNIDVITENIDTTISTTSSIKINTNDMPFKLDNNVINRLNTLFNLVIINKNISTMNKVDKKIAQEVFTMLPDITKTEQGKVTSYPSVINKNIVSNILSNVSNELPESVINILTEINSTINTNIGNYKDVVNSLIAYKDIYIEESNRLNNNKPIIIYNNDSRNLFTSEINTYITFDDTKLGYDKYSGKLISIIINFIQDSNINIFINTSKALGELSLQGILDLILKRIDYIVISMNNLEDYYRVLKDTITNNKLDINDTTVYLANNSNSIIEILDTLNILYNVLKDPNNFFEKLEKLLKFID